MSSQLLRLKRGARTLTAVAVVSAACAIVAPAAADAASRHAEAALATGVGLRHQPSIRVRELQRALVRHGYSIGRPGVDGRFGPLTRAAVRRAQRKHDLKVDGIAGPRTLRALRLTGAARAATQRRRARGRVTSQGHEPAPRHTDCRSRAADGADARAGGADHPAVRALHPDRRFAGAAHRRALRARVRPAASSLRCPARRVPPGDVHTAACRTRLRRLSGRSKRQTIGRRRSHP